MEWVTELFSVSNPPLYSHLCDVELCPIEAAQRVYNREMGSERGMKDLLPSVLIPVPINITLITVLYHIK